MQFLARIAIIVTLCLFVPDASAQEEAGQDVLRVSVEEVRIPVAAYDAGGRFDPTLQVPDMSGIMEAKGGGVVDLDRLFRRGGKLKKELERREAEFGQLTEETGGALWLPSTTAEMLRQAAEAAREIDSRYVVTYKPRRPIASAKPGEYRKLDVLARRQGLTVRTRRGYVAKLP